MAITIALIVIVAYFLACTVWVEINAYDESEPRRGTSWNVLYRIDDYLWARACRKENEEV